MKYKTIDTKVFPKRKDAVKWVDDKKKRLSAAGTKYKTDINYLSETDQWEAELLMKLEQSG